MSDPDEKTYACYNEILDYMREHCETDSVKDNPEKLSYYTELMRLEYEDLAASYNATTPFEDDYFSYTDEEILEAAQERYALDLIVNRVLKLEGIDPRSSDLVNYYKQKILDICCYKPEKSDILGFIRYHEFYRIVIENAEWDESYNDEEDLGWTSYSDYGYNGDEYIEDDELIGYTDESYNDEEY